MEEQEQVQEKKENKFLSFLKRCKDVLMKTTNGMAIGLFGTLIIGQTDKDPVAPVGVVVNAVEGGYIVAFAGVAGATGYKAYYVDSEGQDVDNEVVTNGGRLTKVDSLPAGTYKVYVSTLIGEKESPRSESFGTFTK